MQLIAADSSASPTAALWHRIRDTERQARAAPRRRQSPRARRGRRRDSRAACPSAQHIVVRRRVESAKIACCNERGSPRSPENWVHDSLSRRTRGGARREVNCPPVRHCVRALSSDAVRSRAAFTRGAGPASGSRCARVLRLAVAEAVAVILREFGEEASYFDPHAITPVGKTRLAQLREDESRIKLNDQRAAAAGEKWHAAVKEIGELHGRLTAAKAKLARCKPGFFGRVNNGKEQRELAALEDEMRTMQARHAPLRREWEEATEVWRASGGIERFKARLEVIRTQRRK